MLSVRALPLLLIAAAGATACENPATPSPLAAPSANAFAKDQSSTSYAIEDLGIPAGMLSSVATNINEGGDVIGEFRGPTPPPGSFRIRRAFLYTTAMQDLGLLPGTIQTRAFGINNKREVVGTTLSTPVGGFGRLQSFLWTPDGVSVARRARGDVILLGVVHQRSWRCRRCRVQQLLRRSNRRVPVGEQGRPRGDSTVAWRWIIGGCRDQPAFSGRRWRIGDAQVHVPASVGMVAGVEQSVTAADIDGTAPGGQLCERTVDVDGERQRQGSGGRTERGSGWITARGSVDAGRGGSSEVGEGVLPASRVVSS